MIRSTLVKYTGRCPWGLVGMIVLTLLVEGYVERRALTFHDTDEWAFRWTSRAATRKVKQAELLCFGDSLVKLGVIPSVVQERTGMPVFNLAVSGSQAPTSYFLLKRALDSGSKPKAVVVDFAPPLLRTGPRHILSRWGIFAGPAETAQLAWWAGDAPLFGEVMASQVLPTLRAKTMIRSNVMEALGGRAPIQTQWNGMAIRNWDKNQGAQLMAGSAAAKNLSDADVVKLREGYYPEWKCHPANREGLDRFLDLASRHEIQVFWLLAPLLPELQDKLNQSGIDARHEQFLREWQSKYPNVVVLDARRKVLELDAFWDPQHLSVDGAAAFSRVLGDTIRQTMSRPDGPAPEAARWVALPQIKLGPLGPGIENMDQSGLAFQASRKLRR